MDRKGQLDHETLTGTFLGKLDEEVTENDHCTSQVLLQVTQ